MLRLSARAKSRASLGSAPAFHAALDGAPLAPRAPRARKDSSLSTLAVPTLPAPASTRAQASTSPTTSSLAGVNFPYNIANMVDRTTCREERLYTVLSPPEAYTCARLARRRLPAAG